MLAKNYTRIHLCSFVFISLIFKIKEKLYLKICHAVTEVILFKNKLKTLIKMTNNFSIKYIN